MDMTTYQTPQTQEGVDILGLVALVLIVFGGIMVLKEFNSNHEDLTIGEENSVNQTTAGSTVSQDQDPNVGSGQGAPFAVVDPDIVAAPYDEYILTQGLHGYSYGHMAIDIAAGKNAIIKSPIHGYVADLYTDQWGNPTLVIENEVYQVTMLHGKYKVAVGDQIELGQMVGRESNFGYTTDYAGRSCHNRDCGYHTHLNIFDKRIGSNVDPLSVIE
jgi:murein DD-endopeptidase MepM/ murein hydrolase activator NlpD